MPTHRCEACEVETALDECWICGEPTLLGPLPVTWAASHEWRQARATCTVGGRETVIEESVPSLTSEAGRALVDRESQRLLGISGAEFSARWDNGEFNGATLTRPVQRVACLLPLGR